MSPSVRELLEAPSFKVYRTKGDIEPPVSYSADTAIFNGPCLLYGVTFSDTAALAFEINDSFDNTGTDRFKHDIPAGGYGYYVFDPPWPLLYGLYLDVSTATCKITPIWGREP